MDMHALMRQAQKLKKERDLAKEAFNAATAEGSAANGLVRIGLSSAGQCQVILDPKLEGEELSLLQDLVQVALIEAFKKLEELRHKHLGKFEM